MIPKTCLAIALFLFSGLRSAEARTGDDLATKSQEAKQAMAAGEFQRAANLYSDLVRSVPGNPGSLLNLGMARFYESRYTDAVQALKAALKLQPQLAPANFFLGLSFEKLYQPSLAIAPLRAAVSSDGKVRYSSWNTRMRCLPPAVSQKRRSTSRRLLQLRRKSQKLGRDWG